MTSFLILKLYIQIQFILRMLLKNGGAISITRVIYYTSRKNDRPP